MHKSSIHNFQEKTQNIHTHKNFFNFNLCADNSNSTIQQQHFHCSAL